MQWYTHGKHVQYSKLFSNIFLYNKMRNNFSLRNFLTCLSYFQDKDKNFLLVQIISRGGRRFSYLFYNRTRDYNKHPKYVSTINQTRRIIIFHKLTHTILPQFVIKSILHREEYYLLIHLISNSYCVLNGPYNLLIWNILRFRQRD